MLLRRVMEIVADNFGVKIGDLTPDTRFAEDLHESLEQVETFLECEEVFGISIPDEDGIQINTARQLTAYIEARLPTAETAWPLAPREDARK